MAGWPLDAGRLATSVLWWQEWRRRRAGRFGARKRQDRASIAAARQDGVDERYGEGRRGRDAQAALGQDEALRRAPPQLPVHPALAARRAPAFGRGRADGGKRKSGNVRWDSGDRCCLSIVPDSAVEKQQALDTSPNKLSYATSLRERENMPTKTRRLGEVDQNMQLEKFLRWVLTETFRLSIWSAKDQQHKYEEAASKSAAVWRHLRSLRFGASQPKRN